MTTTTHAPLAFVDTETTGLHADRRAWEVAIIRRESRVNENGVEEAHETELLLQVEDVDLTTAEPKGLAIGGFYDRHENYRPPPAWRSPAARIVHVPDPTFVVAAAQDEEMRHRAASVRCLPEQQVARMVERATRGAHIVGLVPDFDTWTLAAMLRRHRLAPSWHHHLIDVEALAVGWLQRDGIPGPGEKRIGTIDEPRAQIRPPWRSDDLAARCGVEPPTADERHTALGDARWAMRWYDTIMGGGAR